ncbi:DUF4998 domain-containing protein [Albibacterium indicum]|uniref:DUF4998 domain-containing protein n=1 Tax=Albibacterium indicum TaxID=2292082 RepID=UPI0013EF08A3|nr:DUF4998 domain-containing protein [Pedobacter indicus]
MKLINSYRNNLLLAILVIISAASCSKMNDTYKEFLEEGQLIYTGRPDTIHIHPGHNRLLLAWKTPSDPKAIKARIFWNNRLDSIDVPIDRSGSERDSVKVYFDDFEEGNYLFEIFTFDDEGNRSIKIEVIAKVYGGNYISSLLTRPIDRTEMDEGALHIAWGALPDTTAIGSEVFYSDSEGKEEKIFVNGMEATTIIPNFTPQTFRHRTLYLPSRLAIDTFYTEYSSLRIKGSPVPISTEGWSITASSEDVKGGRLAINLIDGNLTNLFVNEIASENTYPHWVIINMGNMTENIEGFYFYQRSLNPTRTLDIEISNDGNIWTSLGTHVLERNGGGAGVPVYLQLEESSEFQYFKFTFIDDYGNSKNVNMHEAGVYTR